MIDKRREKKGVPGVELSRVVDEGNHIGPGKVVVPHIVLAVERVLGFGVGICGAPLVVLRAAQVPYMALEAPVYQKVVRCLPAEVAFA